MKADVIVVLGAALAADGSLGRALAARVETGIDGYFRGLAPRIIMTGALEANAMMARARARGVPDEALLAERTAITTRGNALASSALMREHGFKSALICTQAYHAWRSIAAFRKMGVKAEALIAPGMPPPRQRRREYVAIAYYLGRRWISFSRSS